MVIGRAVLGLVGLVPVFGSRPDFATDRAAVVVDMSDSADTINESRVVIAFLAVLHVALRVDWKVAAYPGTTTDGCTELNR